MPLEQKESTASRQRSSSSPSRLREIALLFARLGFTAFGGPAAHMALMEDEFVKRRNWLDRRTFLDLIAAINFVPGPNSTEMAIELGYLRGGRRGLLTAGVCFITPAMCIILPLAFLYVRYGQSPRTGQVLHGIAACIVAIIAAALWRFARTAIKDRFTLGVGVIAAFAAAVARPEVVAWLNRMAAGPRGAIVLPLAETAAALAAWPVDLVVLGAAAVAGIMWYGRGRGSAVLPLFVARRVAFQLPISAVLGWSTAMATMGLIFLKVGAMLFGSGYLLVSYLQADFVDRYHWLTQKELLDAIAVGQVTPGPLLTTATFIGYLLGAQKFGGGVIGGIIGGVIATAAIFLPAFLIIAMFGKSLPRLRQNKLAAAALDGMNAAVVALIMVVCIRLGIAALVNLPALAIAGVTLIALLRWNVNATWLIAAAAVVGWLCRMG